MDWDQIVEQWRGFGIKATEKLEKLTHEVWRVRPVTKDRETALWTGPAKMWHSA